MIGSSIHTSELPYHGLPEFMVQSPQLLSCMYLQLPEVRSEERTAHVFALTAPPLSNSDELGSLLMMSYFFIYVLVLVISVLIISTIESLAS